MPKIQRLNEEDRELGKALAIYFHSGPETRGKTRKLAERRG